MAALSLGRLSGGSRSVAMQPKEYTNVVRFQKFLHQKLKDFKNNKQELLKSLLGKPDDFLEPLWQQDRQAWLNTLLVLHGFFGEELDSEDVQVFKVESTKKLEEAFGHHPFSAKTGHTVQWPNLKYAFPGTDTDVNEKTVGIPYSLCNKGKTIKDSWSSLVQFINNIQHYFNDDCHKFLKVSPRVTRYSVVFNSVTTQQIWAMLTIYYEVKRSHYRECESEMIDNLPPTDIIPRLLPLFEQLLRRDLCFTTKSKFTADWGLCETTGRKFYFLLPSSLLCQAKNLEKDEILTPALIRASAEQRLRSVFINELHYQDLCKLEQEVGRVERLERVLERKGLERTRPDFKHAAGSCKCLAAALGEQHQQGEYNPPDPWSALQRHANDTQSVIFVYTFLFEAELIHLTPQSKVERPRSIHIAMTALNHFDALTPLGGSFASQLPLTFVERPNTPPLISRAVSAMSPLPPFSPSSSPSSPLFISPSPSHSRWSAPVSIPAQHYPSSIPIADSSFTISSPASSSSSSSQSASPVFILDSPQTVTSPTRPVTPVTRRRYDQQLVELDQRHEKTFWDAGIAHSDEVQQFTAEKTASLQEFREEQGMQTDAERCERDIAELHGAWALHQQLVALARSLRPSSVEYFEGRRHALFGQVQVDESAASAQQLTEQVRVLRLAYDDDPDVVSGRLQSMLNLCRITELLGLIKTNSPQDDLNALAADLKKLNCPLPTTLADTNKKIDIYQAQRAKQTNHREKKILHDRIEILDKIKLIYQQVQPLDEPLISSPSSSSSSPTTSPPQQSSPSQSTTGLVVQSPPTLVLSPVLSISPPSISSSSSSSSSSPPPSLSTTPVQEESFRSPESTPSSSPNQTSSPPLPLFPPSSEFVLGRPSHSLYQHAQPPPPPVQFSPHVTQAIPEFFREAIAKGLDKLSCEKDTDAIAKEIWLGIGGNVHEVRTITPDDLKGILKTTLFRCRRFLAAVVAHLFPTEPLQDETGSLPPLALSPEFFREAIAKVCQDLSCEKDTDAIAEAIWLGIGGNVHEVQTITPDDLNDILKTTLFRCRGILAAVTHLFPTEPK